jgi:antitoxin (DNA-binding transcriptional repressor) of toxin-antitoxin stability system
MMTMISVAQAVKEMDTILDQVQQGREIVIMGANGATFKLIALSRAPQPIFGSARGQVRIKADFDAPIDGFEEYIP